jgi:hypothetical protein
MSESFFSRWSNKKVSTREAQARGPIDAQPQNTEPNTLATARPAELEGGAANLPTEEDAAQLRPGDSVASFLQQGVSEAAKTAALKKLFADPAYNVISEMDDYVEDYSQLAKLTTAEVRKLNQAKDLHLFEDPPWKKDPMIQGDSDQTPVATDTTTGDGAPPAEPAGPETDQVLTKPGSGEQIDNPDDDSAPS